MQGKQDTIDELMDTLSNLTEEEGRRIFNKLTYIDLIALQVAVRKAIADANLLTHLGRL